MALSEQEIIRERKLQSLRNLGINPYPANLFPVTHTSKQVKETLKMVRR
jgi:lysyl-tRNA synthetase class 2